MKILITGGAGFIGSHLTEYLLKQGHKMTILDDLSTGSLDNISKFQKQPNFEFIKHDITKPLINFKVDQIYHLACPASPVKYQIDPVKTITVNVVGTTNVLEMAKKYQIKILQASTSEIYGDPKVHPQPESYWGNVNPVGPRSCYDEGKRCAETLFFDYWREYHLPIKVVRIFNTYGPRMALDDGRVISNFIIQALKGENLTIYGDGSHTRSFQYISDLILGLVKMMATDDFTGPVNLGNPEEYTIKELALKIIRIAGSSSKIVYQDLPPDDPERRRPDISLAQKKLGWEPWVGLEEGLKKTVKYFKKFKY
jgi:UDP-glucuronate decarboxylase